MVGRDAQTCEPGGLPARRFGEAQLRTGEQASFSRAAEFPGLPGVSGLRVRRGLDPGQHRIGQEFETAPGQVWREAAA